MESSPRWKNIRTLFARENELRKAQSRNSQNMLTGFKDREIQKSDANEDQASKLAAIRCDSNSRVMTVVYHRVASRPTLFLPNKFPYNCTLTPCRTYIRPTVFTCHHYTLNLR